MPNLKLRVLHANNVANDTPIDAAIVTKVEPGATYSVIDADTGLVVSDVVIKRVDDSLVIEREGARLLEVQEFYGDGTAFVDVGNGGIVSAQSAVADGTNIVWQAGQELTLQGVELSGGVVGGSLGKLLGALAVAAGAGGGGGGSGDTGSGDVEIFVAGGPVILGNDLVATFFESDGVTVLGTGSISSDGRLTINVGDYEGVVMVRVTSSSSAADYIDETTGIGKDIGDFEYWSDGIQIVNGKAFLNVNILSTIAHMLAVEANGGLGEDNPMSLDTVTATNASVAAAFGIPESDMHSRELITTIDESGDTNADATTYGQVLAMFSAMDDANGGDIQASVDGLVNGIDLKDSGVKFSPTLLTQMSSAVVVAATKVDPAIRSEMAAKAQTIKAVSDAVPGTFVDDKGPSIRIKLSESDISAGDAVTVKFIFSEVPAGFDSSSVSVVGGTLGEITPVSDAAGNKSFTATLTVSDDASAVKIKVDGTRITDEAGNKGVAVSVGAEVGSGSGGSGSGGSGSGGSGSGGSGSGGSGSGGSGSEEADPTPTLTFTAYDADGEVVEGNYINRQVASATFTLEFPAGLYNGSTLVFFMDGSQIYASLPDEIAEDATSYTLTYGPDADLSLGTLTDLLDVDVARTISVQATPNDGSEAYTVELSDTVAQDVVDPRSATITSSPSINEGGGYVNTGYWSTATDYVKVVYTLGGAADSASGPVTHDLYITRPVVGDEEPIYILLASTEVESTVTTGEFRLAWDNLSEQTQSAVSALMAPVANGMNGGIAKLFIEATDAAGNVSVGAQRNLTIDMEAPSVSFTADDFQFLTLGAGFTTGEATPGVTTQMNFEIRFATGLLDGLYTEYRIDGDILYSVANSSAGTVNRLNYSTMTATKPDDFMDLYPDGGSLDIYWRDLAGNYIDFFVEDAFTWTVAWPAPHAGTEVFILDAAAGASETSTGSWSVDPDTSYTIYIVLPSDASADNTFAASPNISNVDKLGADDKIVFITADGQAVNDGQGKSANGTLYTNGAAWQGRADDETTVLWSYDGFTVKMPDSNGDLQEIGNIYLTGPVADFVGPTYLTAENTYNVEVSYNTVYDITQIWNSDLNLLNLG